MIASVRPTEIRQPIGAVGRGAFTLLELLVAMAVMSIMLVILLQTTATSLTLWRASEGKISAGREGRGALQLIQQDLQTMFVPANTNLWPQVVDGTGVRFLALKTWEYQTGTNFGDVCFVEYRYESNAIERGWVQSAKTFQSLTNVGGAAFPVATNFQVVAANVLPGSVSWQALLTNGNAAPVGALPSFLRLDFKAAPSAAALSNYMAGITNNQQVGSFFIRAAVPEPW